jgi:hypothetical protein
VNPLPAVGFRVTTFVKVEAPKRRSFVWVVAAVMPEEARLLVLLA